MQFDDLKNITLLNINLSDEIYTLEIPVKNSYIHDSNRVYFGLRKRDDESKILSLSAMVKNTIDDFAIYEITVSFNDFERLSENDIWDLYIFRETKDDTKQSRVKSNYDHLRFLSIVSSENLKMFYPFTTNKGNVSFRFNEYTLFVSFDEVHLSDNGKLSFAGFFNYPPIHKNEGFRIKGMKLIVIKNNDEESVIDVDRVKRPDLLQKYQGNISLKEIGIKGSFDVKPNITSNDKETFKFFFDLDYEYNGIRETIRSTRINLSQKALLPDKIVISKNNQKKKIKCGLTKKTKYFYLVANEYNFAKETISNLKTNWVKIRRSSYLKKSYKTVFYLLGRLLPANQKLVMFESFLGKQYSDSPRAIYEYMLENHPDYKMFWSVDRRHIQYFMDKDINYVRRFSVKWLLLMTRAKYWVANSRLPLWIPKPKHTVYLQTWHGTPLKRLAADMDEVHMPGTNTRKYKENFLKEASKWDYLVSPNAYSTEIFKRAFDFDKKMIESGYPRNDFLINSNDHNTINHLKERMNLPKDKTIILYAPTWRDNQFYAKGKYKFDLQLDLDKIKSELGEDYIILLRMHYLVAENIDLTSYKDFVYDFSFHEDIRELYLISDILITDYSSVFFDYANLRRPMLFFVYDIEDYRDNLRGFYFDFEKKAPGPLAVTTDEIIKEIKSIEDDGFIPSKITEEFYEKFCYLESGESSKRVVEEVFKD